VLFKGSNKTKEPSEKRELLRKLIDAEGDACTNAIIFCNRKSDVDIVAKSLNKYGYNAAPIHGDLDQSHRTRTLESFRDDKLRFLVASDGHAEDYVHRIGRTGRAGRTGTAIMICVGRDEKNLAQVEDLVKEEIPRLESPLGKPPATTQGAPEDAPTAEKTERPKRTRSRKPKAAPAAEADAQKAEAPKKEAAPAPKQDAPKQEQQREEPQQRSEKPRRERGGRGRNNNQRQEKNTIVGLGDDTPAFIALSFEERDNS